MKTRFAVLAVLFLALFASAARAAAPPVPPLWVKQFGSIQVDYAKGVATDAAGNVYVAGTTQGTIDAPAQAVPNTNKGGADAFVAKFDPQGTLLWVTQFGSVADDYVEAITYDKKYGILYVAGWTGGNMPGGLERPSENPSSGGTDIFLAKVTDRGTIQWIKQEGTAGEDYAAGVATDSSGRIYVAGSTNGSIDGETNPGGYSDAFVMQFSSYGDRMAVNQFNVASTPLNTNAFGVAVDSTSPSGDYIVVTGWAQGYENGSLFVAKFDAWLQTETRKIATFGGPDNGSDYDTGRAVAVDSKGNIVVTGSTSGSFYRNPWAGAEDIIVVKLAPNLAMLWARQLGTDAHDTSYGIALDAEDSIYITGFTGYPAATGGLDGQAHLGGYDIFLTRLAPEDGRSVFTRQIGTAAHDWGYGVCIDPSGAVYLAGSTEDLMGAQHIGDLDSVLVKYDNAGPVPRPATEYFINGTVREIPSGSALENVSISVKDDLGAVVGEYLTSSTGQFAAKVTKPGTYSIYKLKIGYTAKVNPDVVTVDGAIPSVAPVSYMEKIVAKTQMVFHKGYNTVTFARLPAGDHSIDAVFGKFAGNPYVGLIFSFDRPMQYLLLANKKSVGNITAIEIGRSYLIYTSKAFTIDTTYWTTDAAPATCLPATKYRGKIH